MRSTPDRPDSKRTGTCAQRFGNSNVGIVSDAQDGRNMLVVVVLSFVVKSL